jgi:hypothetical protein
MFLVGDAAAQVDAGRGTEARVVVHAREPGLQRSARDAILE